MDSLDKPNPAQLLHNKAKAALALGEIYEANIQIRKALEIDASDAEHRELILEFKDELHNALAEGGWDQFVQGLIIPAIPLMVKNKLGVAEIKRFLDLIPTRS